MDHYPFARITCIALILLAGSLASAASEGKPVVSIQVPAYTLTDTVPPAKTPIEEKAETEKKIETEKPATTTTPSVIKVVPKARKQIKPVALPSVPLKPSKIIKPVIKRVGSLIP